jgi:penicillin-insensitive murein DD-endopeptidase
VLALVFTSAPTTLFAAPTPSAHVRTGAIQPTPTRRAKAEQPAAMRPGRGAVTAEEKQARKVEPFVPPQSVGHPNAGRLEGGIRLEVSKPYFRVVPAYALSDNRWGLPVFVRAIDRAAKAVNKKYPGAALGVGDISRRSGGEVNRHHSHESGRDADLAFYVLDEHDKQVERHGFIKINAKLQATDVTGARFDIARNWLLLQTLLLDREARVSHVFVAEPIKQALLAHARGRGVSRAVLTRAAQVIMEPTGALPHDDHFHVRISCPASAKGCVEIAKNAPSKARMKLARKGRGAMKTPPPERAVSVAQPRRPSPPRAEPEAQAQSARPKGIYLSGATKSRGDDIDVPVSLWALAGAALGHADDRASPRDGREEAESDSAEVKDALDESGAPKITQ